MKRKPYTPEFELFWEAYPKRLGENPKYLAFQKFEALIKRGESTQDIMQAAVNFSKWAFKNNKVCTPFIPHAATWLNQMRWLDYVTVEVEHTPLSSAVFVAEGSPEWHMWNNYLISIGEKPKPAISGRNSPSPGWYFPTRTPPVSKLRLVS